MNLPKAPRHPQAPDRWGSDEERRGATIAAITVMILLLIGLAWLLVEWPRGDSAPTQMQPPAPNERRI